MRRVRDGLAWMLSWAARVVIGAFRVIGGAVLVLPHLLEPGSGWGPERRLSILVGVITVGVLGVGYVLYGP